jgi:NitT/TauT family transport system substrate-binding protein
MSRVRPTRRAAFAVLAGLVATVSLGANLAQAVALPRLSTAAVVRIGFFANLTHAPALLAQDLRLFETFLGKDGTKVEYVLFNAGPAAVEAMKGGAIDVAYIGPTPAVNGFATTHGTLLRVVSGVTSGGAQLVVKPSIRTVADLKGKKLTTPQLGNTQDVALRSWLKEHGLSSTISGGGDVAVYATENSTSLSLFRKGQIDGAWLPEPWASRLVLEAGAKVFLDEKSLWPRGQFVTTNIIAAQSFLAKYPGTVRSILQANNSAIAYIARNPVKARSIVQEQIAKWTGYPLPAAVIRRAWDELTFTYDPLPLTLKQDAEDAVSVGLLVLPPGGLNGIYDVRLLNSVLKGAGSRTVSSGGLGPQ